MRAMVLTGHGGMDRYEFHSDWPVPDMGPDQVLIKVHACGLNNTDVNTRSGWYSKAVSEATTGDSYTDIDKDDPTWGGAPLTFPRIQGADICGSVVSVGADADATLLGKRVMADCWLRDWSDPEGLNAIGYVGSECDGGFADYMVIDHRNVMAIDSTLTHAQLATFSCSYTTAENLLNRAAVRAGDTVLITGASGGVGGALVQLANRRGARTIAMASQSKQAQVALLKPEFILDRSPGNLGAALMEHLGQDTVSVVVDVVGGPYFSTLINVLERGGRYATSGAIAGPMVSLDLRTLYLRDLSFQGCTITSLNVFPDLLGYIERGEISPVLAGTWPLEELVAAQSAFIEKAHVGNIVVTMEAS
ncbi:MAG: zinc-binding dehydrogenase [Granulosicoccus sp.]|nr:zinc-binding dehydrogenase [Granulosicoccus sp.]